MKKFFLFLTTVVVALVIGLVFAFWNFQRHVNSEGFRQKVADQLSQKLNTPVAIGQIRLNLLSGADVSDITIGKPKDETQHSFINVKHIGVRFSPWALLQKKILITQLDFLQPQVLLTKTGPDGTLEIPGTGAGGAAGAVSQEPNKVQTATQKGFQFLIDRFSLRGADFQILQPDNSSVFHAQEADIQGDYQALPSGSKSTGQINIRQMVVGPVFAIDNVSSSISYENKRLALPDIKGTSYGGTASGSLDLRMDTTPAMFLLAINLQNAEVSDLIAAHDKHFNLIGGKLDLTANFEGNFENPLLLTGKGELSIREIRVSKSELLEQIGNILDIDELKHIKYQDVKGTFKVADQKITFFNLEAVSENVQLSGAGSFSFDRQVDFDFLLALDKEIAAKIPEQVKPLFTQREDGFMVITFKVTGTPDNLKTNLPDKLVKTGVQEVVNKGLDKLSNWLKKQTDKKKEPEAPKEEAPVQEEVSTNVPEPAGMVDLPEPPAMQDLPEPPQPSFQ